MIDVQFIHFRFSCLRFACAIFNNGLTWTNGGGVKLLSLHPALLRQAQEQHPETGTTVTRRNNIQFT